MKYAQQAMRLMGERYQRAKAANDPRPGELLWRLAQRLGIPPGLVDFEIEMRVMGVVPWHQ